MIQLQQYNKAIAAAITPIVVWLLSEYGVQMPPDVQVAIGALATMIAVYAIPNKALPEPPEKKKPDENLD